MMAVSQAIDLLRQLGRIGRMAMMALWAYKLRGFFVISAVAFGIASLTVIVAAVDGAERMAYDIVKWFGPDAALIFGGTIKSQAVGQRTTTLTSQDAQQLQQSLPAAYLMVPMRAKMDVPVRFDNKKSQLPVVVGATAHYAEVWNWPLVEGRDLSEEDVASGAKVCLIGDVPARELFGDDSPLGRAILVDKLPVHVIGRLSYRGVSGGGGPPIDDRVVMPISTLTQRFNMDRKYYMAIRVKFLAPENMRSHTDNMRGLLRELHHLTPEQEDDFTIITAEEILKFMAVFKGGLVLFLGITAAVAMVVGGFVLANLFYLSVQERRQEIGLKMALGARKWSILWQILIEAVCLTTMGALVGMILGMGAAQLLARFGGLQIVYSWKVFFLSLAASLVIGLVFGLRPARQAAGLNPIEVLKGCEKMGKRMLAASRLFTKAASLHGAPRSEEIQEP